MWSRLAQWARDGWMTTRTTGIQSGLQARIWGARGSLPCGGADYQRYGGDTSCIEVSVAGETLILDAGTGLRGLGNALLRRAKDEGGVVSVDMLLSHTHYDHIMGLTGFAPFYIPGQKVRVWLGREPGGLPGRETFERVFSQPFFPLSFSDLKAEISFHDFTQGETLRFGDHVTAGTHALRHPGGATAYRIEHAGRSLCYVTDVEHVPGQTDDALAGFVRGTDIMVYDATYTEAEYPAHEGWGHSTWEEGLKIAEVGQVNQFVAFHHDPNHDDEALADIERAMRQVNRTAVMGRQGMTLRP